MQRELQYYPRFVLHWVSHEISGAAVSPRMEQYGKVACGTGYVDGMCVIQWETLQWSGNEVSPLFLSERSPSLKRDIVNGISSRYVNRVSTDQ
jgi:hypothetical protein